MEVTTTTPRPRPQLPATSQATNPCTTHLPSTLFTILSTTPTTFKRDGRMHSNQAAGDPTNVLQFSARQGDQQLGGCHEVKNSNGHFADRNKCHFLSLNVILTSSSLEVITILILRNIMCKCYTSVCQF